jgi:hypothetical protein
VNRSKKNSTRGDGLSLSRKRCPVIASAGAGRCQLGNMGLLYVVMEYAEENLSQILSHRPPLPKFTAKVSCTVTSNPQTSLALSIN